MSWRFKNFNAAELVVCADRFLEEAHDFARKRPKAATTQWTDFVLDWFWGVRGEGITVDASPTKTPGAPSPRVCYGEFMLDMSHTTYPQYTADCIYHSRPYWKNALSRPCEIRLALESEMGRFRGGDETYVRVLEDAAKLPAVRANVKVMVFASHDGGDRAEIVDSLRDLRLQGRDQAPWLWIDLPWVDDSNDQWGADAGVFS
ncbi:MAG TPA: hypothetical protein VH083_08775 [Myxococcales bacterium]|jgi:hypothetical protein|nr:hypothetical protein [Myxococcales bacterium]